MGVLQAMQRTFNLGNAEDGEDATGRCDERVGPHRFAGVEQTYGSLDTNRNTHCVNKAGRADPGR